MEVLKEKSEFNSVCKQYEIKVGGGVADMSATVECMHQFHGRKSVPHVNNEVFDHISAWYSTLDLRSFKVN